MRISDWSSDVCSSDLLDIARIENGSLRIERNRVALPELLDQVVDMFRLQAAAKGLDFEYDRSPRLPGHVFTDEKRLRQILINLISNAIKYTPSGSASLTVRWRDKSEEHTSEHLSLMRNEYAVLRLTKKTTQDDVIVL